MITDPIKFVYTVGDGVTTDFSYAYNGTVGFDADVAEDVRAAILNPDGTRDTNPNFAVLKDTYGNFTGAIRFATAPVANAVVYIYRATPQTQETEYKTSSGFDAKNVENDFDKLTKMVQETSSHARNKTVQLDMFQENVLKFILASEANQNQMLFFDFSTLTFRFTSFTKGQAVISSASASDDKTDIMLTHLTDEDTGLPYLAFSLDQGATWKPMNFAEISAIVNSANAKAQEALDNSETAVSTANDAKTVADGIDAKAQEALDNSETAVGTSNDAKAIAQNAATDAENAVQTATNATDIANAANATAESAKTTATNANTKADVAVSTANSALQKANTAMVQSSDALADAAVSLENSEQAVATANAAKNTADGIDGKATSALTNSEQAVVTANAASAAVGSKVNKSGDTMTGPLTLPGNVTGELQAVPKQQMDSADSLRALKASDFTNPITGTTKGLTTIDRTELEQEIADAKLSGAPLGDGYWFAKTEAATVVPSPNDLISQLEIEITNPSVLNYIDLSGVAPFQGYVATADGTGWTESETVTPPDSRVYIEITKKFLDIAETDNVGGQADWHNDELKWVPVPKFPALSGVTVYDENGSELGEATELQGAISLDGKRAVINLPSNVITSPCVEDFDGKQVVKSLTIQESENPIQDGDDWTDGEEGDTIITSDDGQPDWYLNFVNGLPANSGRQQLSIPVGYTTYTMPDDGYIIGTVGSGDNSTNHALMITNVSNGISQTYVIANKDQQISTRCGVCFPAIKGSVISISRQAAITADLSFIPVAKAINPHPGQVRWPVKILDNQSDGLYTNGSVIVYNDGWMEFHWQKYDVSQAGALLTPPIKFKDKGNLEWQPATSVVGLLRYNGTVGACVAGSAVSPDGSKIWVAVRPFPNMTDHSSVSGYTCGYGDPDVLHTMYPDLF